MLEDFKSALQDEVQRRDGLEERLGQAVNRVSDRVDAISRVQADTAQDFNEQVRLMEMRISQDIQDQARANVKARADVETADVEVRARCQRLEERMGNNERRIQDITHRHDVNIEDLRSSKSKMASTLEQVRMEERAQSLAMQNIAGRMGDLEERTVNTVSATEALRGYGYDGRSGNESPPRGRMGVSPILGLDAGRPGMLMASSHPVMSPPQPFMGQTSMSGSLNMAPAGSATVRAVSPPHASHAQVSGMLGRSGASSPMPGRGGQSAGAPSGGVRHGASSPPPSHGHRITGGVSGSVHVAPVAGSPQVASGQWSSTTRIGPPSLGSIGSFR
jgi:hypothetical protein